MNKDLGFTDRSIAALFQLFDKDGSGLIDYEEFLQNLRVFKIFILN